MPTPLRLRRTVPKSTTEVRDALGTGGRRELAVPAALSGFVRGPLTVVDQRTWSDDRADVDIRIEGQPVRITGTIGLAAAGEACDVDIALTITADVPFVGGMVESAIATEVTAMIERELASIAN